MRHLTTVALLCISFATACAARTAAGTGQPTADVSGMSTHGSYVCERETLRVTRSRDGLSLSRQGDDDADWSTDNYWQADDGDHFVRFVLLNRRRVVVEVVVQDGAATVRHYDRGRGARFTIHAGDDGVFRVTGKPSAESICAPLVAGRR